MLKDFRAEWLVCTAIREKSWFHWRIDSYEILKRLFAIVSPFSAGQLSTLTVDCLLFVDSMRRFNVYNDAPREPSRKGLKYSDTRSRVSA